jgi:hypothetical protein
MPTPRPGMGNESIKVRPGMGNNKQIMIPDPNPKGTKKRTTVQPVKKTVNNAAKRGTMAPPPKRGTMAPLPIDDKIYRTMPITEKQLNGIKKMYGFKG